MSQSCFRWKSCAGYHHQPSARTSYWYCIRNHRDMAEWLLPNSYRTCAGAVLPVAVVVFVAVVFVVSCCQRLRAGQISARVSFVAGYRNQRRKNPRELTRRASFADCPWHVGVLMVSVCSWTTRRDLFHNAIASFDWE